MSFLFLLWQVASRYGEHSSDLFLHHNYRFGTLATPHSKQRGFSRDVINPQDGHILCDRSPVICGFSLRIEWSSLIVNSTISRPRKIPVALISDPSWRVPRLPSRNVTDVQRCQYGGSIANVSRNRLRPRSLEKAWADCSLAENLRWENFRWTGLDQKI
jgi:hypothetical protein